MLHFGQMSGQLPKAAIGGDVSMRKVNDYCVLDISNYFFLARVLSEFISTFVEKLSTFGQPLLYLVAVFRVCGLDSGCGYCTWLLYFGSVDV